MSATPYMPLWVGDYLSDTQHLSAAEHGAYMMLIMAYWQRGGPLPDGPRLAHIARLTPAEWAISEPVLREFFTVQNGLWSHKRIDAELEKVRERQLKASTAGKASAKRRSNSNPTQPQLESNGRSTDVDPEFNSGATIPTPEPSKYKLTTSEQEPARESEAENTGFVGVGLVEPVVSPAAKLKVAQALGLADAEPIVEAFRKWQVGMAPAYRARDMDAVFVSSADKIFRRLPAVERLACGSVVAPEPSAPIPKASSALLASLNRRGGRHAH